MKFVVAGSKIICQRPDNTATGSDVYRHVIEFDADVAVVPPQVAERLTRIEKLELQRFLAERQQISATATEINLVEAVPGLLREATEILRAVDQLNNNLYRQLVKAAADFGDALENARPPRSRRPRQK
jgi:hypothetical protein